MTLESAGRAAAEQIGIDWRDVAHDSRWHEVAINGKDTRNGAGRIKVFSDEEGGTVWNHITGESLNFWAQREIDLDPVDREIRKKKNAEQRAADEAERCKLAMEAGAKTIALWKAGQPSTRNPYLDRKGVESVDSLKQVDATTAAKLIGYTPKRSGEALEGRLLIAPVKIGDKITSCQLIDESGRKANLYGGELKGGYWSTAKLPDGSGDGITLLIAEGVATALSSSQATGHPALAAMSCGNLRAVSVYLRQRYPDARLIVCSDKGNGEADARRAAMDSGAVCAIHFIWTANPVLTGH